jgi:RNA polymerase sigma-70 factor, ECF subfamily
MTAALANSSATAQLLDRVRAHEPQAIGELLGRHRARLRKMVRLRLDRRLRDRLRSADVADEVVRDAARHVGDYLAAPGTSFFLWLRQRAGQRLQELHRQHLGAAADVGQELSLARGAQPVVDSRSLAAQLLGDRAASQAAVRAELLLRLQDALNGMDRLDREILALCHFEELSEAEAAAVLGLERAAAEERYIGALKRLHAILRGIPGFLER